MQMAGDEVILIGIDQRRQHGVTSRNFSCMASWRKRAAYIAYFGMDVARQDDLFARDVWVRVRNR